MTLKSFANDWMPPALKRFIRPRRFGLFGDYPTWAAAQADSATYDTDITAFDPIVREIRAGGGHMGELPNAVLTGAALGKKVNVLDFGGNLGMGYFRAVTTMPEIIETWHVVDLSPVVEYGSKNFSDQRLKFFTHIESATDKQKPDVVICDAVLSFMSEPYAALVDMAKTGASIIVLDRTRMFLGDSEKITVQQNYSNIGNDRRPFRVVSSNKVAASLSGYRLVAQKDHNAPDPGAEDAKYMAQVYLRTIA